jgi:hypothetical protein
MADISTTWRYRSVGSGADGTEQICGVRHHSVQRRTELHQWLHDLFQMNELLTRVDEPTAEHSVHHHSMGQGQEQPQDLQYEVLAVTFYRT